MTTLLYIVAVLFAIGMLQSISLKSAGAQIGCMFLILLVGGIVAGAVVSGFKSGWQYTERQVYADNSIWMCDEYHLVCKRELP